MQSIQKCWGRAPSAIRYLATFSAGAGAGAALIAATSSKQPPPLAENAPIPESVALTLVRSERKLKKLQRSAQEIIQWKATDQQMLGLTPRLWMEVFDKKHRYASTLYSYWRRWQLSDSNDNFWDWLDHGMGSLIDLPEAPRRLLDEWHVLYMTRKQQLLFRVEIDPSTGRFLWAVDGTPVTLPPPKDIPVAKMTEREKALSALLTASQSKGDRRDRLLAAARQEVEAAMAAGEEPTKERLESITRPLIQESLLCQLRDPFFAERHDAASTPLGHAHHRTMPKLPEELLPGVGWEHVHKAISHDLGQEMNTPFKTIDERGNSAIFVLDSFGPLYCGVKIRGILQHSSFVRGHCVKVAGGLVLKDGWLVELSPHSGHYQPGQETVEDMMEDWRAMGVDFSNVKVKPFQKVK